MELWLRKVRGLEGRAGQQHGHLRVPVFRRPFHELLRIVLLHIQRFYINIFRGAPPLCVLWVQAVEEGIYLSCPDLLILLRIPVVFT